MRGRTLSFVVAVAVSAMPWVHARAVTAEEVQQGSVLWRLLQPSAFEQWLDSGMAARAEQCRQARWSGKTCQDTLDRLLAALIEAKPCDHGRLVALLVESAPKGDEGLAANGAPAYREARALIQKRLLSVLPYVPPRYWESVLSTGYPPTIWDPEAASKLSIPDGIQTVGFVRALRRLLLSASSMKTALLAPAYCSGSR